MYVTKNFARKHMDSKKDQLKLLESISSLYYYSSSINTKDTVVDSIKDSDDLMFLKCAKEAKADFLVSNDFRSGMHEQNDKYQFTILNADDFVEIMTEESNEE